MNEYIINAEGNNGICMSGAYNPDAVYLTVTASEKKPSSNDLIVVASSVFRYTKDKQNRKIPFIHNLLPLDGHDSAKDAVLAWIIRYCRDHGYEEVYAYNSEGKHNLQ